MYLCIQERRIMSGRITNVLLDFGGVIADEGYRNGVREIARINGLDPDHFARVTGETLHGTGYLTGQATEAEFWRTLRSSAGIKGSDQDLRSLILKRFTVRVWMIEVVSWLKGQGVRLAILSDQTNWLDELEEKMGIFPLFDHVFNSYHLGKSKKDITIFTDVLKITGASPVEALFVDDTPEHVGRAVQAGLNTILFAGREDFLMRLRAFFPGFPG